MKKNIATYFLVAMSLISLPSFSQSVADSTLLGLPGDNLDLYAVLDLFQKSKTIEDFEKSLNLESTGINNLDLNLDNKVDFIKVVTKQDNDDFTFILQDAVTEDEIQDVGVILVTKDEAGKVSIQMVGDEDLYGKDYIVELKETSTPAVTANPGYTGPDTVKVVTVPATTTTVVVQEAPIVQYVYSPVYVPYYPPYYYGYYPPYFRPFPVMAIGIYWGNHAHYHNHYGYHGNTTIIHNTNNFNNYNNSRNTSNTVSHNRSKGEYSRNNSPSTRPNTGTTRPSAGTRPSTGTGAAGGSRPSASTRPSTGTGASGASRPTTNTRPSTGTSGASRPSTGTSHSGGMRPSTNTRPTTNTRQSTGASRFSGGSSHGGGSYGGGGSFGGGSRVGGGRR